MRNVGAGQVRNSNTAIMVEKEQPFSKGEAIGESKKIGARKCCYVPKELKGECDKNY